MKVSRGDVVLVDDPFTDRTGSKVRPALVVQNDGLNQRIADTILVSISRSTHRASATQLHIDVQSPDGVQSSLRQDSMVQCESILTFDRQFIIAILGKPTPALMQRIDGCLKTALELP